MITVSSHREGLTILNGYEPNNTSSKYMKQRLIELKGETASQQLQLETFNTHSFLSNQ